MKEQMTPMRFGTGVEPSRCRGPKIQRKKADEMRATGHYSQFEEDFKLIRGAGCRTFRAPLRWQDIQKNKSCHSSAWSWGYTDRYLGALADHGFDLTLDFVHHDGAPDGVSLDDPSMPERTVEFCLNALERYYNRYPEMIKAVNIQNEPLTNALYCGLFGKWSPFKHSSDDFVRTCVVIGKTVCKASRALAGHPVFGQICQYYNDPCEVHQLAPAPYMVTQNQREMAQFCNDRRFLMLDMVLGMIDDNHPLIDYLRRHGFTTEDQEWFLANPARIDRLGLDYYASHEHEYHTEGDLVLTPNGHPVGPGSIILNDYWPRYRNRVGEFVVGETNMYAADHVKWNWFLFNWAECEWARKQGCPINRFDWHGFFGGAHWNSELTEEARDFSHFGIAWLEGEPYSRNIRRRTTLFYEKVQEVVCGGAQLEDQVMFETTGPMGELLKSYINGPMAKHNFKFVPAPKGY